MSGWFWSSPSSSSKSKEQEQFEKVKAELLAVTGSAPISGNFIADPNGTAVFAANNTGASGISALYGGNTKERCFLNLSGNLGTGVGQVSIIGGNSATNANNIVNIVAGNSSAGGILNIGGTNDTVTLAGTLVIPGAVTPAANMTSGIVPVATGATTIKNSTGLAAAVTLDTAASQTLNLGNTNATTINLGNAGCTTTILGTTDILGAPSGIGGTTGGLIAIQGGNSSSSPTASNFINLAAGGSAGGRTFIYGGINASTAADNVVDIFGGDAVAGTVSLGNTSGDTVNIRGVITATANGAAAVYGYNGATVGTTGTVTITGNNLASSTASGSGVTITGGTAIQSTGTVPVVTIQGNTTGASGSGTVDIYGTAEAAQASTGIVNIIGAPLDANAGTGTVNIQGGSCNTNNSVNVFGGISSVPGTVTISGGGSSTPTSNVVNIWGHNSSASGVGTINISTGGATGGSTEGSGGINITNTNTGIGNIVVSADGNGATNIPLLFLAGGGSATNIMVKFQTSDATHGVTLANGSVTWASASDRRLKDKITPCEFGLAFVMASKPSSWFWKSDGKKDVGFIAQELEELGYPGVLPPKDLNDEKDYYQLEKDQLVPILYKAVQELDGIIQQLGRKIDAQNEIIAKLMARLDCLESK